MTSIRPEMPRVAIAHQTVTIGDAIGNDIAGSYSLLEKLEFQVSIICEYAHPAVAERFNVMQNPSAKDIADSFDLVLYHHSVEWPLGEERFTRFSGPVVAKYHNITPAHFFKPYSELYSAVCERGSAQTQRLVRASNFVHWQADSTFNANELRESGLPASKIAVVPPFMRCDELFMTMHCREYDFPDPLEVLFMGRRAPNKGHRHLLRSLTSFKDLFPAQPVRLTVVGSVDEELAPYYQELERIEADLGIASDVRWVSQVSDEEVRHAFATSHIYLHLSEHEGFCVPVLEAQAMGLPVVSLDSPAIRETVGPGQLLFPQPQSQEDYDVLAGILFEIARNPGMREQLVTAGYQNVYGRFTSELLENRFLEDLRPWLGPVKR